MKKIIIGIIIVLVLVAGISFFVLQRIGGVMIDAMIDSEIQELQNELSDNLDNPTSPISNETPAINEPLNTPATNDNNESLNTPVSPPESTPEPSSQTSQNTTPEPTTKPKATPAPTKTPDPIKVSIDDLKDIKEEITPIDKINVATLVLENLSTSDISELESMLSGGLTKEEKKKAKEIAYDKFTPEEIAKIKELYHKYLKK